MRDRETYVCLRAAFNLLVAYVSLDELNIASVHPRVSPLAASLQLIDRAIYRSDTLCAKEGIKT
jgi:hypothetical protein